MIQPPRSIPITETSTLLRVGPPPCSASVLSLSWVLHLSFSLIIGTTGSHVPHKSLDQVHATFMPDAAQAVNRFPLDSSWSSVSPQFRRRRYLFSTPHQWFACARLPEPHLTQSQPRLFHQRSPQGALDPCSLRWFGACSCKPTPRGLPSSPVQLRGAR